MKTEVATMMKRVRTLEEDYDGTETKLHQTSAKLDEATKAADESERYGVCVMSSSTLCFAAFVETTFQFIYHNELKAHLNISVFSDGQP